MYWSSVRFRSSTKIYYFYHAREYEYLTSPAGNQVISCYNHQDAGTGPVLHGFKVDSDVVVVCRDTVVYILIVLAYSKLKMTNNWYLKYDHEKLSDIKKTCSYLGEILSLNLSKIQALTGCKTTSYFCWVREIKIFKKLLGQQDLWLLSSESGSYVIEETKLIRPIFYNRNKKESCANYTKV